MLSNIKPQLRVPVRFGDLLAGDPNRARGVFVVKKCGLILDVRNVDEDDYLVNLNSLFQHHSCRIQIVGRRIALHTSVEKLILRKVGCDPANEAVAPGSHALRSRIAQHEDARMKSGKWNVSNRLVAKAKIVGIELVRIPEPWTDTRAIRLEREMTHRIACKAKSLRITGHGAVQDRRAVQPVKRQKSGHAERQRQQKQLEPDTALPTLLTNNRIHLVRARLYRAQRHSSRRNDYRTHLFTPDPHLSNSIADLQRIMDIGER